MRFRITTAALTAALAAHAPAADPPCPDCPAKTCPADATPTPRALITWGYVIPAPLSAAAGEAPSPLTRVFAAYPMLSPTGVRPAGSGTITMIVLPQAQIGRFAVAGRLTATAFQPALPGLTGAAACTATATEPPCPAACPAACPACSPPAERMTTKVFQVMDLVTPIPDFVAPPAAPGMKPPAAVGPETIATRVEPAAGATCVILPSPPAERYMATAVTPPVGARMPSPYVTLTTAGQPPRRITAVHVCAADGPTVAACAPPAQCPQPVPAPTPARSTQTSEQLIKLVTGMVRPHSWADNGGRGTVEFYGVGGALVVNNTPDVLREVNDLLDSLRKLQESQIVVECRLVSVPAELGAKMMAGATTVAANTHATTFLSEADLVRHLTDLQECPRTNVLQLPKMTVFNGQTTHVTCADQKTFVTGLDLRTVDHKVVAVPKEETVALGTTIQVRPTLSADGRFVDLAAEVRLSELDGPCEQVPVTHPVTPVYEGGSQGVPVPFTTFIQQPSVARWEAKVRAVVPATGRTVAIRLGTRTANQAFVCEPPVVSKIPYLNRLFTNAAVAKEQHDVIALVTIRGLPEAQAGQQCATAACSEAKPTSPAAGLVAEYRKACADGRTEDAMKLAMKALAADPTCFAGAAK